MRLISFVTHKGGSGKTTLTFCGAAAAQEKGKRVLILDMDPRHAPGADIRPERRVRE